MQEFKWRDRQTIRWERFGCGSPVVFCHGTPWSSKLWRPIATALASRYTVYLWDMPGYGQSTQRDAQDVSLAAQGQAFADLLKFWNLDDPVVIAHDYGGAVSLRAHLLHDALYRALALVDVVAVRPWGSPFFRLVGENPHVFSALPARLHEALVREYIAGAAHKPLRTTDHAELVAPWLGRTGQDAFYRQIAQADERYTDDVQPMYPSLQIPVLIAWGEEDTWIPVDRAHLLASAIPRAELRTIPDAGHLIQLDAPEYLTEVLSSWLNQLPD